MLLLAPPPKCKMAAHLSSCLVAISLMFWLSLAAKYDGKVRAVGDGSYEAYMIPPNTANHASFIEHLPTGDLMIAWFSGTKEGKNDVSIYTARLSSGTDQWSNTSLVSRRDGFSNQNPVLYYDSTTKILNLWHSQQLADEGESNANVWHLQSTDGQGMNWTKPEDFLKKPGAFDRNRVITSLNGGLILPIYYAVSGDNNQFSAMELSQVEDHTFWTEYDVKNSHYLVQPSVIRPTPSKSLLRAFFRDRRAEHIYSAISFDEGKSWTSPEKTGLPNNNAAIQATVLSNGKAVICYNPTNKPRDILRISVSEDGGETWPHYKDIQPKPHVSQQMAADVEYSYPSVLQTSDGYIHVTYTFNRETIKYVKFMESWIYKT